MTSSKTCRLPSSGFTETTDRAYRWATEVVSLAKKRLNENIAVRLWAYREQGSEMLAADFWNKTNSGEYYSVTFFISDSGMYDLHPEEPIVPDMTEAIHLAGIVIDALNAEVIVGRRGNEVNKNCTEPWFDGQTNGKLKIKTD